MVLYVQDVQQMIDLSLARYSADRIGKFDFALENSGGSIILDKCSKTYSPSIASVTLFGYPLWHVSTTPKVIIQVSVCQSRFQHQGNHDFNRSYLFGSHKCILEIVGHLKEALEMPR